MVSKFVLGQLECFATVRGQRAGRAGSHPSYGHSSKKATSRVYLGCRARDQAGDR
jgi:hypothetical protein